MNKTELCDQSTKSLLEQLHSRDITATSLLESCIARIELLNPLVNAVVTTAFDEAYSCALAADKLAAKKKPLPQLHGLPVLVKDLTETKGIRTTYGSLCFENNIAAHDAAIVTNLKNAGALIIGKTNTPEFGAGANTTNSVFGMTRNPFSTELTSGGSSGGSAVVVSCGMSPLATGSDLGGSLRIPASFCGVVGKRPTSGMIPSNSHICGFSPLWTDGPIARSVTDVELAMEAMVGFCKNDPLSIPTRLESECPDKPICDSRVGFSTDLGIATVDLQIAKLFDERIKTIASATEFTKAVDLDLSAATSVFRILRSESLFASYEELLHAYPELLGENIKNNLNEATQFTLADSARAHAMHTKLFREFHSLFDEVDFIIVPATAVSPFPVTDNHPTSINGETMNDYYSWYTITWVLSLMACPIVAIPCGMDQNGMPFGIQVVGPRYGDARTLKFAARVEQLLIKNGLGRCAPNLVQKAKQTQQASSDKTSYINQLNGANRSE